MCKKTWGVSLLQGMNFLTGYLILVTKDEEKAFWLLDALLGHILPGMVFFCLFVFFY